MVRPLRIALTIGPAGYGGTATYAGGLAAGLARRHDVALVTVGSAAAKAALGFEPAAHIQVSERRAVGQLQVAALRRRLVATRADLFHGTRQVLPLHSPVPTVLTFHDDYALTRRGDYDLLKRYLLPPVYRRSLRIASAVVVLREEMAETASRFVSAGVDVVATGAAVPAKLAEAPSVRPAAVLPERYALAVGDGSPRKNLGALLDDWGRVRAATGLGLVVAGGRRASAELRNRLASEPGVVFVPEPSWGELAHLYSAATVVVEPSLEEGFGFAQIEAAHFGRPYVPLRDQVDSVRAIADALAAGDHGSGAGVGAQPGWDDVAARVVAVYRAVLSRDG